MNQYTEKLKWPEVFSLAGLNAAIVISWIAYHEYQPVLLEKFDFVELADFLVLAKGIVLVVIPPFAGWLADWILRKKGKYFTVFAIGIGSTAMVFMVVASIIGSNLKGLHDFLPYMIVIWLVAMNLFISPANSMIEAFAPVQKLPIVVGVLFLTTELLYALEPVIIDLIHFFGDTMTFVVGGLLIAITGVLFQRISSDEVILKRKRIDDEGEKGRTTSFLSIIIIALGLGLAKALLVELLPELLNNTYPGFTSGGVFTFGLLGFSAILGFSISGLITRYKLNKIIVLGFVILLVGSVALILKPGISVVITGSILVAIAFSLLNISGLPFAIRNLTPRNITYGVGIYIGAGELFTGIFENL